MCPLNFADPVGTVAGPGAADRNHDHDHGQNADLAVSLLPWVVSLMLHLGIALLAAFTIWTVKAQVEKEEVIIPNAHLSQTPGVPLIQREGVTLAHAGAGAGSNSAGGGIGTNNTGGSGSHRTLNSRSAQGSESGLGSPVDLDSGEFGLGSGGGGNGKGGGGGDNPFGQGVQAGDGIKASFYGSGGNARRLVYMVDASGSLIGTFPNVIEELKRSIGQLSDQQDFTVLFFQGDDVKEIPPFGLRRATPANKAAAIKWMDTDSGNIIPMGLSNPVKALQVALRYRPHLLFLLSNNITGQGRYEVDQRQLLDKLQEANTSKTKINTYQFVYPDPLVKLGMKGTMEQIAQMTGGVYKFLDARELGIE